MVILTETSLCVSPTHRAKIKTTPASSFVTVDAISSDIDDTSNNYCSRNNKLDNHHNCQIMPEAGDVSVLAPTPLHHNNTKLNSPWNNRRHLKLNLNQCLSAGVNYNAANLSGRVVTTPCTLNRPSRLGVSTEETHMSSKKSKLDICQSVPFSTPASSLPGNPNHLHINLQNNHHLSKSSCGSSSPSGNSVHPSDNVLHYRQTFSSSSSSSYSFSSSSNNYSSSVTNNQLQHRVNPATSPTTAFFNNFRSSPLSSPVATNCGCGIVCSAITSCSPPSSTSSTSKAKLKSMSSDELAAAVGRSRPIIIIDVRSSNLYHRNHVQGAFNLCCTDKTLMGKSSVFDILGIKDCSTSALSPSTKRKSPSSNSMDIVVYDDHTTIQDLPELSQTQDNALCTVLTSLLKDGKDVFVLDGGFKSFSIDHEALCRCSNRTAMDMRKPLLYSPTNGVHEPEIEAATATQVLPFLYLGNERDAKDLSRLKSLNISYVLNVTSHVPQYYDEQGIRYKRIPASDNAQQNLKQYFEEAIEYIDDARQNNAKVLIHCHAGVSRSATITIAYLLKHTRMAMQDAYKFVKGKRAIISPNFNFMGQLQEFEKDLNDGTSPRILQPRLLGIESSV